MFFVSYSIQELDWLDVIKTTYKIVVDQNKKKHGFDVTLSNTLKIGGYYQVKFVLPIVCYLKHAYRIRNVLMPL